MGSGAGQVGTIEVALSHARRLLARAPALAVEQATEILRAAPDHREATLLLGMAQRRSGSKQAAVATLEALTRGHPGWARAHYEQALALGDIGRPSAAIASLGRALALDAGMPEAWRTLGDQLLGLGDTAGADDAYLRSIRAAVHDPQLIAAANALCANQIPQAEGLLRAHLKHHPTDVAALRMLAEVAARLRRFDDAQILLLRCLELAPGFTAARHNYAVVLHRQGRAEEALRQTQSLLELEPDNPGYQSLKAAILSRIGDYHESIALYEGLLAAHPHQPKIWMSYGHALKTNGREADSVAAYEKSIELLPSLGEAYWSLANLKTVRFRPGQIESMRALLARQDLPDDDRLHLHFALGKALEDAGEYPQSFEHYSLGNQIRRAEIRYSAQEMTRHVRWTRSSLTSDFFQSRHGHGCPSTAPIFIVGLPRSGSTLIEQILSSHSQVEGTMELPDIPALARELASRGGQPGGIEACYEALGALSGEECRALGEQYLERTRIQRRSNAPFFIDKLPNNFAHAGLIHLLLPNARIIDARRHPLGCGFSGFKQHFARGQHFTYSLEDIGRYYRDYVELMAHFDQVLPGRVHRVFYESMVGDTETEVRRLLEYCGLPFEEQCLRFHETSRAVRTASSQQVRQPIYRAGLDQWRHYEPWLQPLKTALGPVLDAYPGVPDFPVVSASPAAQAAGT